MTTPKAVPADTPTPRTEDWLERLGNQYGARQAAALRGDDTAWNAANYWMGQIASDHWHELIASQRELAAANAENAQLLREYASLREQLEKAK